MIDLIQVQADIATLIRKVWPDATIVSWDDMEGTDARRDCYMINAYIRDGSPGMVHYYEGEIEVAVTYFAPLVNSREKLSETISGLYKLFAREYTVDGMVLLAEDHSTHFTEYEVDFSFTSAIRLPLEPLHRDVGTQLEPWGRYENLDEHSDIEEVHTKITD